MEFSEEKTVFYHELGMAITHWADVEYKLCRVTLVCFMDGKIIRSIKKYDDFYAGFFAIENFRSKLKYSDTIITRHLHSSDRLGEWTELHKRLEVHSQTRNYLAHWMAIADPNADPAFAYLNRKPPNRCIGLGPRILKPIADPQIKRAPGKFTFPPGTLFVRDIASARLEFFALAASLENFACRVAGMQEISPKSDEQAKRAPQMAQLVSRIRKELAAPPKPSHA